MAPLVGAISLLWSSIMSNKNGLFHSSLALIGARIFLSTLNEDTSMTVPMKTISAWRPDTKISEIISLCANSGTSSELFVYQEGDIPSVNQEGVISVPLTRDDTLQLTEQLCDMASAIEKLDYWTMATPLVYSRGWLELLLPGTPLGDIKEITIARQFSSQSFRFHIVKGYKANGVSNEAQKNQTPNLSDALSLIAKGFSDLVKIIMAEFK